MKANENQKRQEKNKEKQSAPPLEAQEAQPQNDTSAQADNTSNPDALKKPMDNSLDAGKFNEELIDITSQDALVGPDEKDEAEKKPSKIEEVTAERDMLKEKLLRALAESENMRKRANRDRLEAERYGGTKLARDVLFVYDNLKRALDAVSEEQKEIAGSLIEGVELTLREILKSFSRHAISPIEPKEGDIFDPQHHQAMFEAALPNTKAGQIIQVMETGFLIHDRLLRPAKVGVSSTPTK